MLESYAGTLLREPWSHQRSLGHAFHRFFSEVLALHVRVLYPRTNNSCQNPVKNPSPNSSLTIPKSQFNHPNTTPTNVPQINLPKVMLWALLDQGISLSAWHTGATQRLSQLEPNQFALPHCHAVAKSKSPAFPPFFKEHALPTLKFRTTG